MDRIINLAGTPREIGLAAGRMLGKRLDENIEYYLQNRPVRPEDLGREGMESGVLSLLDKLPARFREELAGLAEGAGLSLRRVVEWLAIEQYVSDGCSGFTVAIDGQTWVGRNNDLRAPEAWGYTKIKHVTGRIPTVTFGMAGDVFTGTGINREQLWLHSQHLPASDRPRPNKTHFPGYVILTEALETCSSIGDVEKLLGNVDRDGGMLLFAVDGKTGESVILECNCLEHLRQEPRDGRLIATNHSSRTEPARITESSACRFERLTELAGGIDWTRARTPGDLITILADDRIEEREGRYITVESAVACPGENKIWYTLGGWPAASRGNWTRIDWPW